MSELAPNSPNNATPTKRRRWMLIVLIVLTICGGTYWWQNRLTPDELVFVGRWKATQYPSGSTSPTAQIFEFHSNRTAYANGRPFRWTADNGQLHGQMQTTYHQMLWILLGRLRGEGSIDTYYIGSYEIVDQNKIIMTHPAGSFVIEYVWTRIVEN